MGTWTVRAFERRIERLEEQVRGSAGGSVFIFCGNDETPDEARARYFSENPEKRNARRVYPILMMETSFGVRR